MHQNRISPTPQTEPPKSTRKRTELLISYFLWLKISGLYYFDIPKTENICKTYHRILFHILFIFNILVLAFITTFCFCTTFIFPFNQEQYVVSLVTLLFCSGFAAGRILMYIFINAYFPALAGHLLRSQHESDDQLKYLHFTSRWPVFILTFPIVIIFALLGSGIAMVLMSHWGNYRFLVLKLSFYLLIVQAITQQVAILFVLIGTCFYSLKILKDICESLKDLPGMNGDDFSLSVRSLCHKYSDFVILMDELNDTVGAIIAVLILTLGAGVLVSMIFRHNLVTFEISGFGIFAILGCCALIGVLGTLQKLVDKNNECKFNLIRIKLDQFPDESKIDLCIFQERIFQTSIPLAGYLKTLPPIVAAFTIYQLKNIFD